ncbi:MAG: FG-GAP-like repeat-containing protein, partial [Limisphaerales bacterium]
EAGDRLTVRVESQIGNARPRLRLLNPLNQTISSVDGGTSGVAEFYSVTLSLPGTYRVRTFTDHQVSSYGLRVDLSRGPSLEVEPNNSVAQANIPVVISMAGSFRYHFAGSLTATDTTGDFINLGTLDAGNIIASDLFIGAQSSLQTGNSLVSVFRTGDTNAVFSANTNFSFVVSDRDSYFVRVSSQTNLGLNAIYFLTLTVTDAVAPTVQAMSLPAEGATTSDIINSFSVTFSEPMNVESANNVANYQLRNAGADNVFGTSDDELYTILSPGYTSGPAVSLAIGDGPLQPGSYRFTIANTMVDRAGNPLTPAYIRNFVVGPLGIYRFENRNNDVATNATSLSLNAGQVPDGSFRVGSVIGVGTNPYFVLSGMFNGDGHPDLAVANYGSGTVSILAGNGNTTFAPIATASTPAGPIALATGDVNGDGIADLLTANNTAHSVSVLIGNGNGTFQAPTNYSVGTNPRSVALGDFDGDGVLDFVTANTGGGNITIRRGNGDGSFGSASNIVTGARAHCVAIGDLNGDGFLDLAVANETPDTVSVLLGNGDGTFAAPVNLPVTSDPRSVVIADLNGDGAKDLAVIGGSTVSVLLGNGNGTFATPVSYATGSSDPYQIIAADLDLDGDLDLAVANYGGRVTVLENNGFGVFSSPANYTVNTPISLAAGDFNGDGTLEVAVANYNTHNVTILRPNMTQALAEDPVGSGIRTGAGRGNLSSSSDVDYWSFTGRAGDRLVVASENVGNFSHTGLRYRIERPDGVQVAEFYGSAGSSNGSGQSAPVILPVSGTYYVRVSEWNTYSGEYRLRVTLAPSPWQLESEDN